MAWRMAPYQATEQIAWESVQGPSLFFSGPMYCQYGAATQYGSSNTETSLLLGSPTVTDMRGGMFGGPLATRIMPAGAFSLGTHFHGDFYGTIQTNGTPNLQMRLGIVGPGTAPINTQEVDFDGALALYPGSALSVTYSVATSTSLHNLTIWGAELPIV